MRFLIEPYNAYQKPPKKKHWMEIAEEEALQHRMIVEEQLRQAMILEQAIQEAQARNQQQITSLTNQNIALPQYTPQPAQQQVQDGQYASPAGGAVGYEAVWSSISKSEAGEVASFTYTPSSGVGPLRVFFTNTSTTPDNDTFFWIFGSGSLTSNIANPGSRLYTRTGSYTVTLQETSSTGNMTATSQVVTVTPPALNPRASVTTNSLVAPLSASFTNTSFPSYAVGDTLSYNWVFDDGTVYAGATPPVHIYGTGSFSPRLDVTESIYGLMATYALPVIVSAVPTLIPHFTAGNWTGPVPFLVNFNAFASTTYNGHGTLNYSWSFGDGSSSLNVNPTNIYQTPGVYNVQMWVTESTYNIAAYTSSIGFISASA